MATRTQVEDWYTGITSDMKNYDDMIKKDLEGQKALALVMKDDVADLKAAIKDRALLSDVQKVDAALQAAIKERALASDVTNADAVLQA